MQAAPLNPDAFALLPASAGLTPPLFSLAARLADSPPRLAKAAASDARTKPPGGLFILHAPLLI